MKQWYALYVFLYSVFRDNNSIYSDQIRSNKRYSICTIEQNVNNMTMELGWLKYNRLEIILSKKEEIYKYSQVRPYNIDIKYYNWPLGFH